MNMNKLTYRSEIKLCLIEFCGAILCSRTILVFFFPRIDVMIPAMHHCRSRRFFEPTNHSAKQEVRQWLVFIPHCADDVMISMCVLSPSKDMGGITRDRKHFLCRRYLYPRLVSPHEEGIFLLVFEKLEVELQCSEKQFIISVDGAVSVLEWEKPTVTEIGFTFCCMQN